MIFVISVEGLLGKEAKNGYQSASTKISQESRKILLTFFRICESKIEHRHYTGNTPLSARLNNTHFTYDH
jgi:hypothetical protein